MNTHDVEALYTQYVLPTYSRTPLCLVKGKGSKVWDIEGHMYLDFFPGWGVSSLGHCHPKVVSALKEQGKKLIHLPNNYFNLTQARLAQTIVQHAFPGRVFFCNSGAEAVEAAIKFARRFGGDRERYEIITMHGSFHGRTLGALTATGQTKYRTGFGPLPVGFRYVPFNDAQALRQAFSDKTVAVMLEPVQGEGGVQIATPDYVQFVRTVCNEHQALFIADEVQCGVGRTGHMFAYQHYGVEPDVLILAKALGGGAPIGAMLAHDRLGDVLTPGTHASTFGGNPLVTRAALAVFRVIEEERLLEQAREMGTYILEALQVMKSRFHCIKEVRGLGLMIGVELSTPAAPIVTQARKLGLLINCTQDTVIRIMPALTMSRREADQGLKLLEQAFEDVIDHA